ncbi:hypothetical protein ACFPOI_59290 [Nonomuraea angiospora]|uniref:Uncharacterized protein n=1 Tax=Nonomuraea angiospora TaxID=46172 RepID=A0ABR9LQH0_9ACTN|nr:hypothetical protein [Nonomuraea angiospora]MBE1582899.1 hypothetical protein [Nonomuraea angiospora]
MDGKRSAWYQVGKLMFQGSAVFDPAELTKAPVTPAGVIAGIKAAILDEDRRGPQELNGHVPPQILFMERSTSSSPSSGSPLRCGPRSSVRCPRSRASP